MNNIISEMLLRYECKTKEEYINAFKEIVQEIALYALSLTDFFDKAAFYGGTALRIFYNLDRFSEDLDFSLCDKDTNFKLESYFTVLENTFKKFGLNFSPEIKVKSIDSDVQSAFLKGNTLEHLLLITPLYSITDHIQKNEVIKIKFEIDTNPPKNATYEVKYRNFPIPYKIKIFDEPSLFAGKIHALLCRKWVNRVKGRDLYDFAFYIKNGSFLNIDHLKSRMIQTKHLNENDKLNLELVKEFLYNKINIIDLEKSKEDIFAFISNKAQINVWSKDYFYYLINNLKSNDIYLVLNKYDISTFGNAKLLDTKYILKLKFDNIQALNKKINYLRNSFLSLIYSSDEILNFGDRTEIYAEYYEITGVENLFIDSKINIDKLIKIILQ